MPLTVATNKERRDSLVSGGGLKQDTLQRRQKAAEDFDHNFVELNPTRDAQIDPLVLYWVKYTDLEGWVLVIHYYTKRDPTNLALLDE